MDVSDPNNQFIEIRDQNPDVVGNIVPDSATTIGLSTTETTPRPSNYRVSNNASETGPFLSQKFLTF